MNSGPPVEDSAEAAAIRARYERRKQDLPGDRYSMQDPATWQIDLERQRAMNLLFANRLPRPIEELRIAEVGCGTGGNLLQFIRLGCRPGHLTGIDLIDERIAVARERLPATVTLHAADAAGFHLGDGSQDVVYQAVVFSSILENETQVRLARQMWRWLKPGGALLWYDFIYDNPRNPDVRGVPLQRIRQLFPGQEINWRRVTLAPPLARAACNIHPRLYGLLNIVPWLRTHVLCWMVKR